MNHRPVKAERVDSSVDEEKFPCQASYLSVGDFQNLLAQRSPPSPLAPETANVIIYFCTDYSLPDGAATSTTTWAGENKRGTLISLNTLQ